MKELILTIEAVVFVTLAWFAMKHFRKNDATNNREAEEQPLSTSSSSQVPSEVENQAFDYDVFLSFRGDDTRRGFTSHLYHKLEERGLRAFKDDVDLKKGERITTLLQCIEKSNICIPILSKRYAESRWCLMEIAKMVECRRIIIPVFYDVVPSDVRRQRGPFAEEFAKHKKREDAKKVKEWRKVLSQVGDISGYDLTDKAMENEAKLIHVILKDVQSRLGKIRMEVTKHPVGIESRVDEMLKLLDLNSISDVRMVGIHGEGGLGKTTISKAVYNQLLQTFENRCCFLLNVRETANQTNGLASLQARLIEDILHETDVKVSDVEHGIATIKERIKSKRILLILDDVDSKEQLDKLAGDAAWFGPGSRIIISTRNEEILERHRVVPRYKPPELEPDESLKLFSRHAFENDQPHLDYVELSKEVVEYAGGLPLALEVFGPIFFPIRNKEEWVVRLGDLKRVQHKDLSKRLRISYEALDLHEKFVFLDIACCLIGWKTEGPQCMWKAMRFQSVTIKALQQKSLVKIDKDGLFAMHDQIRDMGRNIVEEESFDDPGNRSRLWDASEISKVLETERRDNIEVITLNSDVAVSVGEFEGMPKLRFLSATNLTCKEDEVLRFPRKIKCLLLKECHSKKTLSFETSGLQELVELDLSESEFSEIRWNHQAMGAKVEKRKPFDKMPNLKLLTLNKCKSLTATPDLSGFPRLEKLVIRECSSLAQVDGSIGLLHNLTHLSMTHCLSVTHLPENCWKLESLEYLNLCHASLKRILDSINGLSSLKELDLSYTKLEELPDAIGKLESLERLYLYNTPLKRIPDSINGLTSLKELYLSSTKLEELPDTIGKLGSLERLDLKNTLLKRIPDSINGLTSLKILKLSSTKLEELPDTIGKLGSLERLDLKNTLLKRIPDSLNGLSSLKELYLSGTKLEEMPDAIGKLESLERLHLCHTPLKRIPDSINGLSSLKELYLFGTKLEELPDAIGKLESIQV